MEVKKVKPLGHYIKSAADRLEEAEKIYDMNGDPYFEHFLRNESWILLRLSAKFWFCFRWRKLRRKLFSLKASKGGK